MPKNTWFPEEGRQYSLQNSDFILLIESKNLFPVEASNAKIFRYLFDFES